ncbi:Hypothetical predicted protein, partial [Paramuricea clavata]
MSNEEHSESEFFYPEVEKEEYKTFISFTTTMSTIFKDIGKLNGEEYKPGTISSFQRSIQHFLSDNKSQFNILRDKVIEMSHKVLVAKRKSLVNKAGKGSKPNATRSFTQEEENKLFECGQFGMSGPEVLQRTMWWFLALHFGFRGETKTVCYAGAIFNSKETLMVAKCSSGCVNEARKHAMLTKTVHRDPFSQRITPPDQKDALL